LKAAAPQEKKINFSKMYDRIMKANNDIEGHPYKDLMLSLQSKKHPILQVLSLQSEVYKPNPEKKKKPIEQYLDTITYIYKKSDLDILINPVTPTFVFERWNPKEIAIFEEAILRFGKQFEFIAELIRTKNAKDVYEFYLEWRTTSHYKSYRSYSSNNRSVIDSYI
jgi:hypothetical protein